MKVPRLHVGTFPLLLLSLLASTSTCVEGKCSSFLLQTSFLRFPKLLEELHYDGTVKFKIRQLMILIVLVNSKIIK